MALRANIRFRRDSWVLEAALDTPRSGVTAIYGPSGCGKTTLLRILAGLERGAEGTTICFGDQQWQRDGFVLAPERRGIGYVFQEGRLFPHLRVIGNLDYASRRRFRRRGPGIDEVCDWLQIQSLLQRWPGQLSGGEQQRVAIARALLNAPQLLLLDEPLTGLDADIREKAMGVLEALHRKLAIPVIIVSHDLDEVMRLADNVLLLRDGKVAGADTIEALTTSLDSPLSGSAEASAVLQGVVAEQDPEFGLCSVDIGGGLQLVMAQTSTHIGAAVRLRIPAKSVSLSRSKATDTSILNILPARIENWRERGKTHVLVRLLIGTHRILALITRRSLTKMALTPGEDVFAQIKGVALLSDYINV